MKRTRLRNKFFKTQNEIDRENYNRQRNFCVSLIRKEKKDFYSNIKNSDIIDNKKFWKTVKPLFTDKVTIKSKITLIEKDIIAEENGEDKVMEEVITDDIKVSEVFNDYFLNIVPNLNITTEINIDKDLSLPRSNDQMLNSIKELQNHDSIVMIKTKNKNSVFSFSPVTYDDVLEEVLNLNVAKASQQTDVPTKVLKQNSEYFAEYFFRNINYCIRKSVFPHELKQADVIPVHKKKSKNLKEKYRPVSILSNISKANTIFF